MRAWQRVFTCICVSALLGGGNCIAQSVPVASGLECLVRLRAPDYPAEARPGRGQGTLKVTVSLTSNGEFHAYRIDEATEKAFVSRFGMEIEKALRLSKFSSACGGKEISLVFTFGFETSERRAGVFFGPPNRIDVIVENPPLVGQAGHRSLPPGD
jgi:hypothetical protein